MFDKKDFDIHKDAPGLCVWQGDHQTFPPDRKSLGLVGDKPAVLRNVRTEEFKTWGFAFKSDSGPAFISIESDPHGGPESWVTPEDPQPARWCATLWAGEHTIRAYGHTYQEAKALLLGYLLDEPLIPN